VPGQQEDGGVMTLPPVCDRSSARSVPTTTRPADGPDPQPAEGDPIVGARQRVHLAQAVLGAGDPAVAWAEGFQLLKQAEDLLDQLSSSPEPDRSIWWRAVALRDDLGGYLLAASTLHETGVAVEVVVDLMRRAAACAGHVLEGMTAPVEERRSA
jgi:hypothetical protein